MRSRQSVLIAVAFILSAGYSMVQADNEMAMKNDNEHIRKWNAFAQNTLNLHKQLITSQDVIKKSTVGGYSHMPDFYQENSYFNKATGKLLSRVRWNRNKIDELHTIEVFLYDEKDRVVRDFTAAFLPLYRNAPNQTLISLHAYNNDTHAFRTFDASGFHILDRCEGKLAGKKINILLDEDELYEGQGEKGGVMQSEEYKLCMKGLPDKLGVYLKPQ